MSFVSFTKSTIKPFLQDLICQIDDCQLTPPQELLLTQYYLKQKQLSENIPLEHDIWDYLSLGIFLLQSEKEKETIVSPQIENKI